MSEVAKKLRERRANVWEQAKELADRAADENRAFSGEEEKSWVALNSELDALDVRIKAVLDGEQRAKDAEDAMSALRGEPRKQGGAAWPGRAGGRRGRRAAELPARRGPARHRRQPVRPGELP